MRRRLSACALPRPSATASAKLANTTVNHSQNVIWAENRILAPAIASRMTRMVVTSETISTTNITGLRHSVRGSSLRNASMTAVTIMLPYKPGTVCCRPSRISRGVVGSGARCAVPANAVLVLEVDSVRAGALMSLLMDWSSVERAGDHLQVFDHGADCKRWEIDQATGNDDHTKQQRDEQAVVGWERAGRGRDQLFGSERAGNGEDRHHHGEAPNHHCAG